MYRPLLLCLACLLLVVSTPRPAQAADNVLNGQTIRILLGQGAYADTVQALLPDLNKMAGGTISIDIVGENELYPIARMNSASRVSTYDMVAVESASASAYRDSRILLPVDGLVDRNPGLLQPGDFLPIALESFSWDKTILALPVQTNAQLLWYRQDLFAAAGLTVPRTTDELMAAAKYFTQPDAGQYGICWDGERGQPLGRQMAAWYAAFGQPLLDQDGLPVLNTAKGLAAAKFAAVLVAYSPPNMLTLSGDDRARLFAQGRCAMFYGWSQRDYLIEADSASKIAGKVGYAACPAVPGVDSVCPIESWGLGIAANIDARRLSMAQRFLVWFTGPQIEAMQSLSLNANGGPARIGLLRDSTFRTRLPIYLAIDQMLDRKVLQYWMYPRTPQWPELAQVLGTVYDEMLHGKLTPEAAADQAQKQALALFKPAP